MTFDEHMSKSRTAQKVRLQQGKSRLQQLQLVHSSSRAITRPWQAIKLAQSQ
jgi:hypothetical protein